MNRIIFIFIFFLSHMLLYSMDYQNPHTITFFSHPQFPSHLFDTFLSKDLYQKFDTVLFNESEDDYTALHTINTLNLNFACTCKALRKFVNNKSYTLQLIKGLSTKYNESNEFIATHRLHTKTASNILLEQRGFFFLAANEQGRVRISDEIHIKKSEIDLNFTYGSTSSTRLMLAVNPTLKEVFPREHYMGEPHMIQWLLKNSADTRITNKEGFSAPLMAIKCLHKCQATQLIEYFLNEPACNLDVNQQYTITEEYILSMQPLPYKTTLLLYLLEKSDKSLKTDPLRFDLVKKLLVKGADPEIAPGQITPLEIAKQIGHKKLIDLLESAIAQKYNSSN